MRSHSHPDRVRVAIVLALTSAAPGMAAAATDPNAVLDEVIVTASKRTESAADVPAAISVLSGEQLEAQGAFNFESYFNQVPGLSLVSNGQPGRGIVSLRGVSTGASQTSATVGWYLDDVQFGSSGALAIGGTFVPDPDLFDVNRIEVLKGPQGTLYGAATLGGLIKLVRNAPDPSAFAAKIAIDGNNVTEGGTGYGARGMVNVPISENSAIRAVVTTRRDAGFVDNVARNVDDENATRVSSGRVAWLYKPTETFSAEVSAFYQKSSTDGVNQTDVDPRTLRPTLGELQGGENFVATGDDVEYQVYAAKLDFDLGIGTLTSVTSFAKSSDDSTTDVTNNVGFGVVLPYNQLVAFDKFSQELRLASPTNERFDWLVGAFYTKETNTWDFDIRGLNPVTLAPLVPTLNAYTFVADTEYTETAAFATGTVHLGSAVDLVLGGRYSKNKQNYRYDRSGIFNGGVFTSTVGNSSDDPFNFAVALQWRPVDDLMLYARAASGYRPGGPQVSNLTGLNLPTTYDPDTVKNYEIGAKGSLMDGRFRYDATVYQIDWDDIQLLRTVVLQVNGQTIRRALIANAGSASSKGAEFSMQWAPVAGLVIGSSIAYVDATLGADAPALGGVSGDRIPYSAKWSGTASADYSRALTPTVTGTFGLGLQYVGERTNYFPADPAGNIQARLPAYTQIDLRATVAWDQWELGARVNNLTDKRGIISAQTNAFQAVPPFDVANDSAAFIRPRTFALTISRQF
jgi:outer membrane receptor protein involved in Fe transport